MGKVVRVEIEEEIWRKVKAKASLQGKNVKDFVSEVLEKEVMDIEGAQ